jgi:hypothetical protein
MYPGRQRKREGGWRVKFRGIMERDERLTYTAEEFTMHRLKHLRVYEWNLGGRLGTSFIYLKLPTHLTCMYASPSVFE